MTARHAILVGVDAVLARLTSAVTVRADRGWEPAAIAESTLAAVVADGGNRQLTTRLLRVANNFGLTQQETALISVAVLAEQNRDAHLLLGLLSGDAGPGRPTVALALELAGLPPTGRITRHHLSPHSALIRYGLLRTAGGDVVLARRVVATERLTAYLAGDDVPSATLLPLLAETVPMTLPGTTPIAEALRADCRLVWVHSPCNGAGTAMAVAACRAVKAPCLVVDLGRLPDAAPADDAVAAALLECGLTGRVLVLAGAERTRLADALTRAAVPVVAVSASPWDPSWSSDLPLTVTADRPSAADRRLLWRPLVGDIAEEREINGMPLSPGQIVALARHAVHVAQLSGEGELTVERVRRSARELNRGRTANASPDPTTRLADLVLPPDALQEIQRLLDWARQRDDVPARRLLPGKGGKGSGITALFAGPPGTGKTLAAHIIADSLGMDLHQIDLSSVIDKYIGETEKHLERAFTDAESTNALLFFDEADALFGARSGVRDAKDRYANQEVAYLLQRIEQFDGITVLASNLRGNIDPAFARRLHFIIAFPPPDRPTRRTLWARHLAGIPADPADPVDVERLADQEDLSGGDIRNIVLAATYASVAAGTGIGMRHLRDALHREYLKLGRRPTRIA